MNGDVVQVQYAGMGELNYELLHTKVRVNHEVPVDGDVDC